MRRVIVAVLRDRNGNASELGMREIVWICPHCTGRRGDPVLETPHALSLPKYRRTPRHVWRNPCGHHDPLGQHRASGPAEGVLP